MLACVGVAALADRENAGRAQRDGRCGIGVDQYLGGAARSVATILRLEETGVSAARSEEHTSELQSLMRISYADFCLKKKKQHRPPIKPQSRVRQKQKHYLDI